ncbi:MAG: MBL fold metallo-hydrolase [Clostridia bacterium]|nr:MBL fold metallo-hydrolase [Clostridia bacterium]
MKNKLVRVRSGAYVTNTYFIFDDNGHCLIIDPACSFDKSANILNGHTLALLILTHGHLDHTYDCDLYKEKYGAKLFIHENETNYLSDVRYNSPDGVPKGYLNKVFSADFTFSDGYTFDFGEDTYTVIHTPGHTEGSCCIYTSGVLFSGDTLFRHSIGRTDFPYGCSEEKMYSSLKRIFEIIPDDTIVYPGHGFQTTLGEEKRNNPFLRLIYDH